MFDLSLLLTVPVTLVLAALPLAMAFNRCFGRRRSINGKHVVVTGGSSGIGLEIARQAAEAGASVTLVARNKDRLLEAQEAVKAAMIRPREQKVQTVSVDISGSASEVAAALEDVETELGPVFLLVNCAGTAVAKKFEDTTEEDVRRMMDINYHGSVNVTRALVGVSHATGRQVGVLVDRGGRVHHVIIGDASKLMLPDVGRLRAGAGRLRGLRSWQSPTACSDPHRRSGSHRCGARSVRNWRRQSFRPERPDPPCPATAR